jgi:hypothetical protein
VRRAEPVPWRSVHRTERWLREADVPLVLVGNTVWRIKRRPVWNVLAAGSAALTVVAAGQVIEVRCLALESRSPEITANPCRGPISGSVAAQTGPGTKMGWTERRPGWEPPLLAGRAARAGSEGGTENAGISKIKRFHRCTGKLNATQPGVIVVSTSYIRGLGPRRKPSVAGGQHSPLFKVWQSRFR